MSVIVKNLIKTYQQQHAVDHISFSAKKGEILGFLGPNGAGKSTTMKIITCFLPQTSGTVQVCGFDTDRDSKEVRRRVGYLPETNPLYEEMYVREYLEFIARLHRLPNKQSSVRDMIDKTGLGPEQHKKIRALSKGYRQRVGLAQAMIHDPDVLILDEPTSGLDPNQLVDIRNLIKTAGREKTVIFSTHIMQEVQALCDRVLIINQGKLVADDPIDQLELRISGMRIINVAFKEHIDQSRLKALPGIRKIKTTGPNAFQIHTSSEIDLREVLFRFAVDNNITLLELTTLKHSIEDIFQQVTKSQQPV